MPQPHDQDNRSDGAFATTQWQVVASAGEGKQSALADLCQAYWKPLYVYVRRMGYCPHDAQDLTQSFIVHMLEGSLPRGRSEQG